MRSLNEQFANATEGMFYTFEERVHPNLLRSITHSPSFSVFQNPEY